MSGKSKAVILRLTNENQLNELRNFIGKFTFLETANYHHAVRLATRLSLDFLQYPQHQSQFRILKSFKLGRKASTKKICLRLDKHDLAQLDELRRKLGEFANRKPATRQDAIRASLDALEDWFCEYVKRYDINDTCPEALADVYRSIIVLGILPSKYGSGRIPR